MVTISTLLTYVTIAFVCGVVLQPSIQYFSFLRGTLGEDYLRVYDRHIKVK
jgi:hypothetical protein